MLFSLHENQNFICELYEALFPNLIKIGAQKI